MALSSHTRLILLSISLVCLFNTACANKKINSTMADGEIVVDGNLAEWGGTRFFEADRFQLAVANTGDHLYLSLKSEDTGLQRQILTRGLVIWVDPRGGKDKHLGIRFPLGIMQDRGGQRGRRSPPTGEDDFQARMQQALQHLDILVPSKNIQKRMPVTAAGGIEVGLDRANGYLTYELKLPLRENTAAPFGIEAPAGVVGIGLEMPSARPNRPGGARGGRGGGGGGGRGGGRDFGATGENRPNRPRGAGPSRRGGTSDFWLTVSLAN